MRPRRNPLRLVLLLIITTLVSSCGQKESTLPLFQNQEVPISAFASQSVETQSLIALAMMSEFCTNDSSAPVTPVDRPNWSLGCNGACGLQANYLIAFMDDWGFNTRLINFYNVPNQGNHTAVEVQLEGSWRLLDPTFGLFFVNSQHEIAATDEVLNGEASARAVGPTSALRFIEDSSYLGEHLNPGELDHMFWSPDNYSKAEAVFPVGLEPLPEVSLRIEVPVDGPFPTQERCMEPGSECDSEWLDATNRTLQNRNPSDDVSLLARNVGNYSPYFVNSPRLYVTRAAVMAAPETRHKSKRTDLKVSVYFDRPLHAVFTWGSQSEIIETRGEFNTASVVVELETALETAISVSVASVESATILRLESTLVEGIPVN